MVHEIILALVFLAMVAAPALVTLPPDGDKRDSL